MLELQTQSIRDAGGWVGRPGAQSVLDMDTDGLRDVTNALGLNGKVDLGVLEKTLPVLVGQAMPRHVVEAVGVTTLLQGGLLGPMEVTRDILSQIGGAGMCHGEALGADFGATAEGGAESGRQDREDESSTGRSGAVNGDAAGEFHEEKQPEVPSSSVNEARSECDNATSRKERASSLAGQGSSTEKNWKASGGSGRVRERVRSGSSAMWSLWSLAALTRFSQRFVGLRPELDFLAALLMVLSFVLWLSVSPNRPHINIFTRVVKHALLACLIPVNLLVNSQALPFLSFLAPAVKLVQCGTIGPGVVSLGLVATSYTETYAWGVSTQMIALTSLLVRAYAPCLGVLGGSTAAAGVCALPTSVMLSLALCLTFSGLISSVVRYVGRKRQGFTWCTSDGVPYGKLH